MEKCSNSKGEAMICWKEDEKRKKPVIKNKKKERRKGRLTDAFSGPANHLLIIPSLQRAADPALGVRTPMRGRRLIKQRYENMLREVIARTATCSLLSSLVPS